MVIYLVFGWYLNGLNPFVSILDHPKVPYQNKLDKVDLVFQSSGSAIFIQFLMEENFKKGFQFLLQKLPIRGP